MKNPLLGLWLSGANAWSGAARGKISGEIRRTQSAMMDEAMKQAAAFWTPGGLTLQPAPVKRRRRRGGR